MNLDTAVVFLTPIMLHAARRRRCDERPFLYGALFMANGASLLLPGSNLTNLIVLSHEHLSGVEFARAMVLPWFVVLATTAFIALAYRPGSEGGAPESIPLLHIGLGFAATVAATGLILALHNAALPVLAVGIAVVALRQVRPKLDLHILVSLFLLAVALGTLARRWHGPARRAHSESRRYSRFRAEAGARGGDNEKTGAGIGLGHSPPVDRRFVRRLLFRDQAWGRTVSPVSTEGRDG